MKNYFCFQRISLLILLLSFFLLVGCSVKRSDLQITPFNTQLGEPSNSKKVLVKFEESIPGKPLSETIWKNATPIWDPGESKQIGYDQDDSDLIAASAVFGIVGAIAVGTQKDDALIMVPFGRLLVEKFQAGLKNAFPDSKACVEPFCEESEIISHKSNHTISLRVKNFRAWEDEDTLNRININATVVTRISSNDPIDGTEHIFETNEEQLESSVGFFSIIGGINEASDKFAESISAKILVVSMERLSK